MKLSSVLLITIAASEQSLAWIGGRVMSTSSNVRDGKNHLAKKNVLSGPTSTSFRGGGTSLEMTSISSLVTTLVPRIGVLTSSLLYFSPFTAVRQASKNDSLNDLNPVPLAIMAVSSLCWLVYGLSVRNPYVTFSNVPGCVASIWYVVSVLPLLEGTQLQTTQNVVVGLSALTISLWTWLSLTNKSLEQVSSSLGLFASALFIVLSGSPLSTITAVLATKNSSSILSQMTLAQISNTVSGIFQSLLSLFNKHSALNS